MKKRILALVLAAVMVVGLVPMASAAGTNYPDIEPTRWSRSYIEDMTRLGLYKGYDDGMFHPTAPLTTAQAISICVRMCAFEEETYDKVADDLAGEVYSAVNGSQPWFHEDFAVAVEAGIVTLDELESLSDSGKLADALTREEFSEYLVRAMQITVPDEVPELDFADTTDIAAEYAVPVYLLSSMGIVVGDTAHKFNPKDTIRREDSATMFSRAVKYIDNHSLILELYDYATYSVQSGRIASFEGSTLTIEGSLVGKTAVELPRTVEYYEGNVKTNKDAVEAGRWAVVCSNAAGVFAVRIYDGSETAYAGELRSFDGKTVVFNTGTRTVSLPIDRTTLFSAGGREGGMEVYDEEADYGSITASVDPTGRLTVLRFEGGSRAESLFLRSADGDGLYTVTAHNGATRQVKLAKDAEVILPEGVRTLGSTANIGKRLDCRVDNVTGELLKVEVDADGKYVQGGFVRTTVRTNNRTISIEDAKSGAADGYKLSTEATFSYEGKKVKIGDMEAGMFVTLTLSGDTVVDVEAYKGSSVFEGILRSISYGKIITLTVESSLGEVMEYSFNADKVPTIKRGNRVIAADKLREGDTLKVSEKYASVVLIEASVTEADFTGIVEGISITTSGTKVTIRSDETDELLTYPLSTNAEILNGETPTSISSVQGMKVAVTLGGDEIVMISIKGVATTSGEYTGKVAYVNAPLRTLLITLESGSLMNVSVPYAASIFTNGGMTKGDFKDIEAEDVVTLYGEMTADGAFTANLIIVK